MTDPGWYCCMFSQESNGVSARRLPIAEHAAQLRLQKGSAKSPVLNVNDVVVALVEAYRTGG